MSPHKPLQTPVPDYDPPSKTPTGEYRIAVDKVTLWTKIQWGVIGVVGTALAGFVVWALATLGSINSAMAQDKATTEATARDFDAHVKKDAAEKVVIFQMFEEQRKDSKALYETIMTGQKSNRLESIDGGR